MLELQNREINAKKNNTVKDATDAVNRKETLKNLAGLPLIQTLTFSISVQSATPAAIINVILLAPPHTWLLRIKPHFSPTVSQLKFSFHFLEGVRATFMVR